MVDTITSVHMNMDLALHILALFKEVEKLPSTVSHTELQPYLKKMNKLASGYFAYPNVEESYYNVLEKHGVYHENTLEFDVSIVKNESLDMVQNKDLLAFNKKDKQFLNSSSDVYFYFDKNGIKYIDKNDVTSVLSAFKTVLTHLGID